MEKNIIDFYKTILLHYNFQTKEWEFYFIPSLKIQAMEWHIYFVSFHFIPIHFFLLHSTPFISINTGPLPVKFCWSYYVYL